MTDQAFLIWLHARLEHVHGESPLCDYMSRLRSIIAAMPPQQTTPNTGAGCNSLVALTTKLLSQRAEKAATEAVEFIAHPSADYRYWYCPDCEHRWRTPKMEGLRRRRLPEFCPRCSGDTFQAVFADGSPA